MGTKADDDGTFFMVKKNNLSNQVKNMDFFSSGNKTVYNRVQSTGYTR